MLVELEPARVGDLGGRRVHQLLVGEHAGLVRGERLGHEPLGDRVEPGEGALVRCVHVGLERVALLRRLVSGAGRPRLLVAPQLLLENPLVPLAERDLDSLREPAVHARPLRRIRGEYAGVARRERRADLDGPVGDLAERAACLVLRAAVELVEHLPHLGGTGREHPARRERLPGLLVRRGDLAVVLLVRQFRVLRRERRDVDEVAVAGPLLGGEGRQIPLVPLAHAADGLLRAGDLLVDGREILRVPLVRGVRRTLRRNLGPALHCGVVPRLLRPHGLRVANEVVSVAPLADHAVARAVEVQRCGIAELRVLVPAADGSQGAHRAGAGDHREREARGLSGKLAPVLERLEGAAELRSEALVLLDVEPEQLGLEQLGRDVAVALLEHLAYDAVVAHLLEEAGSRLRADLVAGHEVGRHVLRVRAQLQVLDSRIVRLADRALHELAHVAADDIGDFAGQPRLHCALADRRLERRRVPRVEPEVLLQLGEDRGRLGLQRVGTDIVGAAHHLADEPVDEPADLGPPPLLHYAVEGNAGDLPALCLRELRRGYPHAARDARRGSSELRRELQHARASEAPEAPARVLGDVLEEVEAHGDRVRLLHEVTVSVEHGGRRERELGLARRATHQPVDRVHHALPGKVHLGAPQRGLDEERGERVGERPARRRPVGEEDGGRLRAPRPDVEEAPGRAVAERLAEGAEGVPDLAAGAPLQRGGHGLLGAGLRRLADESGTPPLRPREERVLLGQHGLLDRVGDGLHHVPAERGAPANGGRGGAKPRLRASRLSRLRRHGLHDRLHDVVGGLVGEYLGRAGEPDVRQRPRRPRLRQEVHGALARRAERLSRDSELEHERRGVCDDLSDSVPPRGVLLPLLLGKIQSGGDRLVVRHGFPVPDLPERVQCGLAGFPFPANLGDRRHVRDEVPPRHVAYGAPEVLALPAPVRLHRPDELASPLGFLELFAGHGLAEHVGGLHVVEVVPAVVHLAPFHGVRAGWVGVELHEALGLPDPHRRWVGGIGELHGAGSLRLRVLYGGRGCRHGGSLCCRVVGGERCHRVLL